MTQERDLDDTKTTLTRWLTTKMPQADHLTVAALDKTTSGASHDTYFMTLQWQEAGCSHGERLVIRWPPAVPLFHRYDLDMQFRLMKALEGSSVPVPKTHWYEDDERILGTPFLVMGMVDGNVPTDIPPYHSQGIFYDATPDERRLLWQQMIETIADIHAVDWQGLDLSFVRGSRGSVEALDDEIAFWHDLLVFAKAQVPILDEAFDWLKSNRFEPTRLSLCWGDARPANFVFQGHSVAGVLDWEQAFIGPPESDLFWFCILDEVSSQVFDVPRLPGTLSMEETIEHYESVTGRPLENVHFHQVFTCVKSAVGLCQIGKNFEAAGVEGFPTGFFSDNPSTQRLEKLLRQ